MQLMDSKLRLWDSPYAVAPVDEKETLGLRERKYLAHLVNNRPFSLQYDDNPLRAAAELERRWSSFEKRHEAVAHTFVRRLQDFINEVADYLHPIGNMRVVVNVSQHPDIKLPFPDAPAGELKAVSGLVHRYISNAKGIPLQIMRAGLRLLVQPVERQMDQMPRNLNQGGNLFSFNNNELNGTTEAKGPDTVNQKILKPHRPIGRPQEPGPKPE
jgi:hypothetical protein